MDSIDPIKSQPARISDNDKDSPLSSLPEELLLPILESLSPQEMTSARLVDRKWNRVVTGSSTWGDCYFRIASCFTAVVDPKSRREMKAYTEGLSPKNVDLSGFSLTEELVDCVSSFERVETLKLAYVTDLTPERLVRLISLPTLVELDLSCNPLQEGHFRALSEAVETGKLQNIRSLNLSKTSSTLPHLRSISNLLGRLDRLDLSGNKNVVEIIDDLKQLKVLLFSNAELDNAALLLIAEKLTDLTALEVVNNRISSRKMREIGEKFRKLESLDISWNDMYDEGLKALAEGLSSNLNFSRLLLNLNSISAKGAKAIGRLLPNLRELDIQFNSIGDKGVIAIAEGCKQLQTLNVSACDCEDQGAQAVAKHLTELRSLDIRLNVFIEDAAGAEIATHLKRLERLKIGSTRIGEKTIAAISLHLAHLRELELSSVRLADSELSQLVMGLKKLERLTVSDNLLTDAAVAQLAEHLPRLKALSIDFSSLTDAGAKNIAEGLRELEELSISGTQISDTALIATLKNLRVLTSLCVQIRSPTGLSDFLKLLSDLPFLERLQVIINRSTGEFSSEILQKSIGRTLGNLSTTRL